MTTIRSIWLLVAITVGCMVVGPLALAAEEQQAPQKAEEQAQQPQAPEAPAPQEAPPAQQPGEQAQPPPAPEAPAAQEAPPAQPPQAGEQPPAREEVTHPGLGEKKVGEQSLGAPPAQAGPLPAAVECNNTLPSPEPGKPKKLNPCMGNEEAIKNGRQLFWRTGCEACHGPTGGGAMPGAPKLYDNEWKFGGDDEAVFKLVKGQMPGMTMPNVFGLILNDMQIWNIIAWIRTLYNDLPDLIVW